MSRARWAVLGALVLALLTVTFVLARDWGGEQKQTRDTAESNQRRVGRVERKILPIQRVLIEKGILRIGPRGLQGGSGPAGREGPRGIAGIPGLRGPVGMDGLNGQDGAAGQDGQDGAQGDRGDHGEAGPTGPEGRPGNDGAPGAQGATGDQGPSGNLTADGDFYTATYSDGTTETCTDQPGPPRHYDCTTP